MGRKSWLLAGVLLVGLPLAGCGSMKMEQKDGCWVRHSDGFLRQETEEIGVCGRPAPRWSNDRITRLVQECMVEADYRWKNEALNAWNRGQPLPPEPPEHAVMQQCMNDAATSLIRENESLGKRITELMQERDRLRAQTQQDHQDLRESQARMTEALGEAAKRPAPSAYALATSSGSANTKTDEKPAQQQVVLPQPLSPMQTVPGPGGETPRAPASTTAQPASPGAVKLTRAQSQRTEDQRVEDPPIDVQRSDAQQSADERAQRSAERRSAERRTSGQRTGTGGSGVAPTHPSTTTKGHSADAAKRRDTQDSGKRGGGTAPDACITPAPRVRETAAPRAAEVKTAQRAGAGGPVAGGAAALPGARPAGGVHGASSAGGAGSEEPSSPAQVEPAPVHPPAAAVK